MSTLGKRRFGGYGANKRARTTTYAKQMARTVASARYNRAMSSRSNRYVRNVAPKETGYVDVGYGSYSLSDGGSITLLNEVPQGAGVSERVGKKITLKSLQFRGRALNNSDAVINDVAVVIVYDKRPTGSLPSLTDIFNQANTYSLNKDDNSGRFRILKRWDASLAGNTSPDASGDYASLTETTGVTCDFFLPIQMLPTTYKSAGTGGIGDIEEGALYLVTLGSTSPGSSAAQLMGTTRVRFIDN